MRPALPNAMRRPHLRARNLAVAAGGRSHFARHLPLRADCFPSPLLPSPPLFVSSGMAKEEEEVGPPVDPVPGQLPLRQQL